MRTTGDSNAELPRELQSSTPRPIRLRAPGILVLLVIAVLLAASAALPAMLYARIESDHRVVRQFESEAVTAEAEILQVGRPNDGRVRISYRYTADGKDFMSHARIRQRTARGLTIGSRVPVRYLQSAPETNWFDGESPSAGPVWLAFVIPPVPVLIAGALILVLRRQAQLLAEGRAALATITSTEKRKGAETTTWRVRYEWRLLSGAIRTGRYDAQRKTPPASGTLIPIVYDRDEPKRHARYPLSLVRIPGASHRRYAVRRRLAATLPKYRHRLRVTF
jgi:uncharacterized protein DUF3592